MRGLTQRYVTQGYVGIRTVPCAVPCRLAVISRLSARKAGTRFNARGIDDDGNAANLAETETILVVGDCEVAFVQVRGSVPVYWEQQGVQALAAKIQITRSGAASQPGFERHVAQLIDEYDRVAALDLLGEREAEEVLGEAYVEHLRRLPDTLPMAYYHFDVHGLTKTLGGLEAVRHELERAHNIQTRRQHDGCTIVVDGALARTQRGVFRTNCFDCLDRTNVVQGILSHLMLRDLFLELQRGDARAEPLAAVRQDSRLPSSLWAPHRELWADNGDALSRISTGTGSLNATFVRTGVKGGLKSFLSDAAKSASRLYVNNFQDASKQVAIDVVLGRRSGQRQVELYDPLHTQAAAAMAERWSEYANVRPAPMLLTTYNVGANSPPSPAELDAWLGAAASTARPEVVAVCLQEIVPLTAPQMLQSAQDELDGWQRAVLSSLQRCYGQLYVPIRQVLLAGMALLVMATEATLPDLTRVEGTSKKTGLRGISGNKGGIAVRFDWHDTSVCIIGAHLAAGSGHVDDRHANYAAIAHGLVFAGGRTPGEHDTVLWLGDLNYRIAQKSSAEVRALCAEHKYDALLRDDELTLARASGAAFHGYQEAPIRFAPTYKYDPGADTYDSSDKMRAPAWTDRILYRVTHHALHVVPRVYDRAVVRVSDHRPVYALVDVDVCTLVEEKRAAMYSDALQTLAQKQAQHGEPSLPPASTDEQQWWHTDVPSVPVNDDTVRGNPFRKAAAVPMVEPAQVPAVLREAPALPMRRAADDGTPATRRMPPPRPPRPAGSSAARDAPPSGDAPQAAPADAGEAPAPAASTVVAGPDDTPSQAIRATAPPPQDDAAVAGPQAPADARAEPASVPRPEAPQGAAAPPVPPRPGAGPPHGGPST